jgi:predicted Zn finger-like uncharacterized protein
VRIVCDNCATEYEIDLPESARARPERNLKFRCSACGRTFVTTLAGAERTVSEGPVPAPAAATPTPDPAPKGMLLKQEGKVYHVRDLATMQRWIVERRVMREDLVSIGGVRWEPVGNRPELEVFFDLVDQADVAHQASGAAPLALGRSEAGEPATLGAPRRPLASPDRDLAPRRAWPGAPSDPGLGAISLGPEDSPPGSGRPPLAGSHSARGAIERLPPSEAGGPRPPPLGRVGGRPEPMVDDGSFEAGEADDEMLSEAGGVAAGLPMGRAEPVWEDAETDRERAPPAGGAAVRVASEAAGMPRIEMPRAARQSEHRDSAGNTLAPVLLDSEPAAPSPVRAVAGEVDTEEDTRVEEGLRPPEPFSDMVTEVAPRGQREEEGGEAEVYEGEEEGRSWDGSRRPMLVLAAATLLVLGGGAWYALSVGEDESGEAPGSGEAVAAIQPVPPAPEPPKPEVQGDSAADAVPEEAADSPEVAVPSEAAEVGEPESEPEVVAKPGGDDGAESQPTRASAAVPERPPAAAPSPAREVPRPVAAAPKPAPPPQPVAAPAGSGSSGPRSTGSAVPSRPAPSGGSAGDIMKAGWAALDRGEVAMARSHFVDALAMNRLSAEAQFGMGYAADKQGDTSTAVRHYCLAQQYAGSDVGLAREVEGRLRALGRDCT